MADTGGGANAARSNKRAKVQDEQAFVVDQYDDYDDDDEYDHSSSRPRAHRTSESKRKPVTAPPISKKPPVVPVSDVKEIAGVAADGDPWQPLDDLALIDYMLKGNSYAVTAASNLFSRTFTPEQVEQRWSTLLYTDTAEKKHQGVSREAHGILFGGHKETDISEQEDEVLRQEQISATTEEAMMRLLCQRRADFAFKRSPKILAKHYRSLIKGGTFDRFSHPFLTDVRLDAQTSEHPLTEPPDYQVLGSSESKPIIKTTAPPSHSDLLSYKGIELVNPSLLVQDDLSGVSFDQMDIQVLSFADASLFAPLAMADQFRGVVAEEQLKLEQLVNLESKLCSVMSEGVLALIYGEGATSLEMMANPFPLVYASGVLTQCTTTTESTLLIERKSDAFLLTCNSCLSLFVNGCRVPPGSSIALNNLSFIQLQQTSYIFEINRIK